MPEHTIPAQLVDQIRNGKAVLVVGAGIGVASWKHLLEKMNEELAARGGDQEAASRDVAKLLHKGNLTRAAGFLARALGEVACDKIVEDHWSKASDVPDLIRALAQLPFRQVWTTFPGTLIEVGMRESLPSGWPSPQVVTWQEAGSISSRKRTLLKILGDFRSYVVTPTSVRRALSSAADLRNHARSFYNDGTLLFVGFRYGDPDMAALLDRVFGQFEVPRSNHYMIGSGVGPVTVDELMHEHHIEVINLAGKGADEIAVTSLIEYLDDLRTACEAAGVSLAQTRPDADDVDGWLAVLTNEPTSEEARAALAEIEKTARADKDTDKLLEVLMGRAEHEEAPAERARLLRELARMYETEVGDLPRAFTALTAALRVDPADTSAVDEAERLAEDTDGWAELVGDVAEVAGEIEDPEVASRYFTRLGRWYHEKLNHADYGVAAYRQAIRLDPAHVAAYAGMGEIYRKQQRWAELADMLTQQADKEHEVPRKVDVLLALGDLQETQLASTARAIDSYQAAADLDPGNDDALGALERLYKRDERWGKLAKVLEERAEVLERAGENQNAAAVRRELATLRAQKLGDLEGAIGKYESTLENDPRDLQALRALEELYEKVGRTDDYLRVLGRLAEIVPDSERPARLRRLAAELENREGGLDKAIECYVDIVALEPGAEDAYRNLERLLAAATRWHDLVDALERHCAAVRAPAQRVELYARMGEVWDKQLNDPHRAIEGYLNVLSAAEDHREALQALARLYQQTEAWDRAVDILVKHAQREGERGSELWAEAGRVAAEKMDDLEVGERHLEKALELDARHLGALRSLARLHERRASWENAIGFLLRAEDAAPNRLERVDILAHAADLAEDKLEDRARGLGYLLRLLKLDPEHIEAGTRAADGLVEGNRWEEALPILEMLARRADGSDKVEKARREALLGRACEMLGMREKAAKHYRNSVDADTDNLEAALGLASMLFTEAKGGDSTERWQEVDRRYREILARHRGLNDEQVVEIWHRLGVASRTLGDDGKADSAFRRALERGPTHAPSLTALIELARARSDWRTVVDAKRALLATAEAGARVKLFEEIGDACKDHLQEPGAALAAYQEALALRPGYHGLLHKVLDIYTHQKQWQRAIETLDTLAAGESEIPRRAKYRYAAAVIARDETSDADAAVDHFERALDDSPSLPKAFDAIDKLLESRGDWKGMARAYRKQLKRIGEDAPTEQLLRLWTRLGEICLDHLDDPEAALAAYEVAASLDPDDVDRREQLANLYLEAGESRRADAIEELQFLVQADPDRVELYRALSNLYQEEQETDKAYCLAQALVFLGVANDQERALYEQLRPRQLQLSGRKLTEELWQKAIIHPRENRHLNAIFSSLVGSIAATTAQPPSSFNLPADERADLTRDPSVTARVVRYAVTVLGLEPEPQLYLHRGSADGVKVANTADKGKLVPSVLLGAQHADKLDERELAFEVGKRLAYFRPERYVHYALSGLPKVESAFAGALAAAGINEANGVEATKMAAHLKKTVPGAVLEQVGAVAGKIGAHELGNGVVASWRSATDLTANRVGLILCNDLEAAARAVATEAAAMSGLSVKDRLRDLLSYAVSEEYFGVRRHLGLAIREARA
jgi:golgin subfamily B member 1